MQIISLNISEPKEVQVGDKTVSTGIFKEPSEDRLMVRKLNIDGDGQADLTVHGGEFKAVYTYASEFYDPWQSELERDLPWGMFGENLTTEGIDETEICLGDTVRFGEATLQAVQPRQPCFKLGIRFEDNSILKKFSQSERWGIYYRVVEEGLVAKGDTIEIIEKDAEKIPVYEIGRCYYGKDFGDMAKKLAQHSAIPPDWRSYFEQGL